MPAARFLVVVPAAGIGARMGDGTPKQYLCLRGMTVLEHTLAVFARVPGIDAVYVAVRAGDPHWAAIESSVGAAVQAVPGGAERCHSVLNALDAASRTGTDADWVLVHDAARPCLRPDDVTRLMRAGAAHPAGAVLGVPVHDTMKRVDAAGESLGTVDRSTLWHAQTPQMFRLGPLRAAIAAALAGGVVVTDEAQAMEIAGHRPLMVEGHADNIKITRPEDIAAAQRFLDRRVETT